MCILCVCVCVSVSSSSDQENSFYSWFPESVFRIMNKCFKLLNVTLKLLNCHIEFLYSVNMVKQITDFQMSNSLCILEINLM